MALTGKKLTTSDDDINGQGQHLVSLLFDNEALSESAIQELYKRGYEPKDMGKAIHQDLFERPCRVLGLSVDSNKSVIKKAVDGLKMGGIIGGLLAAIGTLIAILIQVMEPSIDLLMMIFVGAIWGGTLGFLIKQFLPLRARKYYERKLIDGNVLIQFWTKFNEKRTYFKHMKWTLCQIGKPFKFNLKKELI